MTQQIETRVLEVFNNIVNDIIYLRNIERGVAEKAALTFIQNPSMLIDLNNMVSEKRKSEYK